MKEVTAFLPCRKNSKRILNKNIRPFAIYEYGIFELKINQLISCNDISKIIISTDDPQIIKLAKLFINKGIKEIILDIRAEFLCSSKTTTDQIIKYASSLIDSGIVLWTHATSPFVNSKIYSDAIKKYFDNLSYRFDSLMSVNPIKGFIWDHNGPINYDINDIKWPFTQSLEKIYEVNNAIFLADIDIYRTFNNRVGENPFLFEMSKLHSVDIDYEEDFIFAEKIALSDLNLISKF